MVTRSIIVFSCLIAAGLAAPWQAAAQPVAIPDVNLLVERAVASAALAGRMRSFVSGEPWLPTASDIAVADANDRADDLFREGRDAIEEGKYERALERFNAVLALKTNRTDAALYWKAYSLAKLGRRAEALSSSGCG